MAVPVGSVFKGRTHQSWADHTKFIIVVKEAKYNDNVLCVFVNSNRPDNPALLNYHIPILVADHAWLHHDSYIGCSLPVDLGEFEFEGKKPVGEISEELLDEIIDKIKDSYEAPPGLLKSYF